MPITSAYFTELMFPLQFGCFHLVRHLGGWVNEWLWKTSPVMY